MTLPHPTVSATPLRPVALACALLAASSTWAQSAPAGPADSHVVAQASSGALRPVVVSGARSERDVEDVPARIDVIEGDALDPTRASDIRELVRELPNVEVRRAPQRFGAVQGSTGRDGNSGFNIRGLQGNRVLLTVDGIRMPRALDNQVLGSSSFGRDYYDLGLISRVEILRGPASALYGSDGLAGMVSMYTTQPKDLLKSGQTFGGRVGVRTDSEDKSVGTGVTLAGIASEQLQWLGSVQVGRAKELDNMGENQSLNANRTAPNPQKDKSVSALGKIILTPGGGQTHTFTLEHIDKDTEVEAYTARGVNPAAANSVLDAHGTTEMQRTRASWDGRFQVQSAFADSLRATVGYQKTDSSEWAREQRVNATTPIRERAVNYQEDLWQGVLQAERTRSLGNGWANTLIYGLDVSVADIDNLVTGIAPPTGETFPLQRFPTTRETTTALFVQSEFVSDRWSIIPALRYDRYKLDAKASPLYPLNPANLADSAVSPKLGLIFRPQSNWQVFANAAGGFKAPSPLQVNSFFANPVANYQTIPNPNLKPETSQTLEVGARGKHGQLNWLATAFTGRYKDFIEENQAVTGTGLPGLVFQSINRSRVKISGFELEGRYAFTPATALRVGYGRTQGRDTVTNQALNSVNPAKVVVGLDHRIADWTVGAVLTHAWAKEREDINFSNTAQQYATPSWTTLDLRATWRMTPSTRLSAAIHNVTDRKYFLWSNVQGIAANSTTLDSYTSPGRSLSLALVTDF